MNRFFENFLTVPANRLPDPRVPAAGWFDHDPSINYELVTQCATYHDPSNPGEQGRLSAAEEDAIQGGAELQEYKSVYPFEFQLQAFKEIGSNLELYSGNNEYVEFYNQKLAQNWDKLVSASNLLTSRDTDLSSGEAINVLVNQFIAQQAGGGSVGNAAQLLTEIAAAKVGFVNEAKSLADDVITLLTDIAYETEQEQLLAGVLIAYAKQIKFDGQDNEAREFLTEVSSLCRDVYGPAVLLARSLVSTETEAANCVTERKNSLHATSNAISINPNPAKDYITMNLNIEMCPQSTILVFNANGHTVATNAGLSGNQFTINTTDFATGTYFVKVISECGTHEGRFVVIK